MTVQVGTRSPIRVVARERRLGSIVRNAGVVVTDVSTGSVATVYSDEDLTSVITSLVTDGSGVFSFYVPPGTYSVSFTGSDAFEAVENIHVVGDDTRPIGTFATPADLDSLDAALMGMGFTRRLHDNFQRPDRDPVAYDLNFGEQAPSGQLWTATGLHSVTSHFKIADNEGLWAPADFGGNSPMQLVGQVGSDPDVLAADMKFVDGTTDGEDYVLACAKVGLSDRAVQISTRKGYSQIFVSLTNSPNPGTSITPLIPTVLSGTATVDLVTGQINFASPLKSLRRQRTILIPDLAYSAVTAILPDGSVVTVADPRIAQYWGHFVVFQQRRTVATDGEVRYLAVAAGFADQQPVAIPSELYFPGATGVDVVAQRPTSWTPNSPVIEVACTPDSTTHLQGFFALWGTVLGCAATLQANGKLGWYMSQDGSTFVGPIDSDNAVAAAPGDSTVYKFAYDAASGNVTFSEGTDDNALNPSGTYVQNGAAKATGVTGAPFLTPTTMPMQIGGRGTSSSYPFKGRLRWVRVTEASTGTVIAFVDFRQAWAGTPVLWRDAQHNRWLLRIPPTATALPRWMIPSSALIGSSLPNPIVQPTIADPAAPAAGSLDLYPKSINGRSMWKVLGDVGNSYVLPPASFSVQIAEILPNGSTTLTTRGTSATSVGTISHVFSEAAGYYANFLSGASAGNTAGTGNANLRFGKGSLANASNGFWYKTRVYFPDASYGAGATGFRAFVGLTVNTFASSVAADDPGNGHIGFAFSTTSGLGGNWQLSRESAGGTLAQLDTGIPFVAQHIYDCYISVAPTDTTFHWRIDDLTAGTTAEGTVATGPSTVQFMRGGFQIATLDAVARNVGLLGNYCHTDR